MALVKCAECGHDVSTLAASCPHCGFPRDAAGGNVPAKERPVAAESMPAANSWWDRHLAKLGCAWLVFGLFGIPIAGGVLGGHKTFGWSLLACLVSSAILIAVLLVKERHKSKWPACLVLPAFMLMFIGFAAMLGDALMSGSDTKPLSTPPRCKLCGAKISIMYSDGDLCEACTKEREAFREAAERLRYLERQRGR